jgi:hypothetical protein
VSATVGVRWFEIERIREDGINETAWIRVLSQQHTSNSASQEILVRQQEVCDRVQETSAGSDPESSPRLNLQRPIRQILGHIRFIFTSEIPPLSPHLHFAALDTFQEVFQCVTLSSVDTFRLQPHLNSANADLNFIMLDSVHTVWQQYSGLLRKTDGFVRFEVFSVVKLNFPFFWDPTTPFDLWRWDHYVVSKRWEQIIHYCDVISQAKQNLRWSSVWRIVVGQTRWRSVNPQRVLLQWTVLQKRTPWQPNVYIFNVLLTVHHNISV